MPTLWLNWSIWLLVFVFRGRLRLGPLRQSKLFNCGGLSASPCTTFTLDLNHPMVTARRGRKKFESDLRLLSTLDQRRPSDRCSQGVSCTVPASCRAPARSEQFPSYTLVSPIPLSNRFGSVFLV